MSRTNIRVDIPVTEPDEIEALLKNILKMHKEIGERSPLVRFDMNELARLQKVHAGHREAARDFHRKGEAETHQANHVLGIAEGQNSRTEGTLYHFITLIRDELLITFNGVEQQLEKWGFNVVLSESNPGQRQDPATEGGQDGGNA